MAPRRASRGGQAQPLLSAGCPTGRTSLPSPVAGTGAIEPLVRALTSSPAPCPAPRASQPASRAFLPSSFCSPWQAAPARVAGL